MLGAFWRAHPEAIGAARPEIHLAESHRKPSRAPPAHQVLRLGPGLEHELPGGIEDSRDDEFTLRGFGGGLSSCVHVSSPLGFSVAGSSLALAARADSRL